MHTLSKAITKIPYLYTERKIYNSTRFILFIYLYNILYRGKFLNNLCVKLIRYNAIKKELQLQIGFSDITRRELSCHLSLATIIGGCQTISVLNIDFLAEGKGFQLRVLPRYIKPGQSIVHGSDSKRIFCIFGQENSLVQITCLR